MSENFENILSEHFTLSPQQHNMLLATKALYEHWNAQINVISRKDMEHFYEHHVLHSLGIALFKQFGAGQKVIDVGTGGGFPGLPLAILFPETEFVLNDSIGKKLKVAQGVADELGIRNIRTLHARSEDVRETFDTVLGRAVKNIPEFYAFTRHLLKPGAAYWYLKGGDFDEELVQVPMHSKVMELYPYFKTEFFETKKVVHMWP